jgi:hypothetical protein
MGTPGRDEAAPYYFKYIDRISTDDIVGTLGRQLEESLAFFAGISEARSLYRYAPEKWSMRQVLNHVNDTERVFLFRALWFARGFESPLPGYDEGPAAEAARADACPWVGHVEEFRSVRLASVSFFRNLPPEAWMRRGIASDNPFTVRALAFILAGHLAHHTAVLQERYS